MNTNFFHWKYFYKNSNTNEEVQDSKLPKTQPGPAAGQMKVASL